MVISSISIYKIQHIFTADLQNETQSNQGLLQLHQEIKSPFPYVNFLKLYHVAIFWVCCLFVNLNLGQMATQGLVTRNILVIIQIRGLLQKLSQLQFYLLTIRLCNITIIMKALDKQVYEQFSFGDASQNQMCDDELHLPFSGAFPAPYLSESSVEDLVDSESANTINSSLTAKRKIQKAIYSQKKIWRENNFCVAKQKNQVTYTIMRIYDLMGQILQYFLQKYIASDKQRQNWQKNKEGCVLKIQRIVDIIKQMEQQHEQDPLTRVVSSLKFIANQLFLESASQKQVFLNEILTAHFNQLKFVIFGKLALGNDEQDSELSVFSEQSFNAELGKSHKQQKLYKSSTIMSLLSQIQIIKMQDRLKQIKSEQIRKTLIQDLQYNLSLETPASKNMKKTKIEQNGCFQTENKFPGNKGEQNSNGSSAQSIQNPAKVNEKA